MNAKRYDVIVIGLGAMGSATCFHLARRGVRVLGLEQFEIPHGKGASHGYSRMIRLAYKEHPDYVPLLRRAYTLWDGLERDSGERVLHITGGIYMGAKGDPFVEGSRAAAELHNLPHTMLDRAQLASRFPQFHLPDHYIGFYEDKAGFLLPEMVICSHATGAMRNGAELHGHEPVLDWETNDRGATVRTAKTTYHADHLVFCGGAWSDRLLRKLNVKLVVTRQALGWVWPRRPEMFQLGTFPVWAIGHGDGAIHYGFPMRPDNPGFKVARHWPNAPCDPDTVDRSPQPGDEEDFRSILAPMIPYADGPTLAIRICLYTNSPDSHFILDRYPASPRVSIACGFSGHGFKFASVIGEAMADLAMYGRSELPIQFLGLQRFNHTT